MPGTRPRRGPARRTGEAATGLQVCGQPLAEASDSTRSYNPGDRPSLHVAPDGQTDNFAHLLRGQYNFSGRSCGFTNSPCQGTTYRQEAQLCPSESASRTTCSIAPSRARPGAATETDRLAHCPCPPGHCRPEGRAPVPGKPKQPVIHPMAIDRGPPLFPVLPQAPGTEQPPFLGETHCPRSTRPGSGDVRC